MINMQEEIKAPRYTVIDAFNKTSYMQKQPEISFGTGSRPPLMEPTAGPGPGAYPIKTTMGKLVESHIPSPAQYSFRARTKFGDPNEKMLSKSSASEPGPGQYDLTGKFVSGKNPRKSAFPKATGSLRDPALMGPGPGSYAPSQSMGKQVLSTKEGAAMTVFPKSARPSLVPPGSTDIGPGDYKPPSAACEVQADSRKPTCANFKFGTGYKKGSRSDKFDFSEPTPGPGSYTIPGGVATKAKGSPFRNAPTAVLSGRGKFGSPW